MYSKFKGEIMKPFGNRLFIKIEESEQKTSTGIILTTNDESLLKGEVISVGDEVKYIKEGQTVYFNKNRLMKFNTDKNKFNLLDETSVIMYE
jgi:co-chaperonin GroES (HSP10)